MADAVTIQALGLTLATFAYPFRNWLIMLEAALAQEEVRQERRQAAALREREATAEITLRLGFVAAANLEAPPVGVAKPQTAEQRAASSFTPGF